MVEVLSKITSFCFTQAYPLAAVTAPTESEVEEYAAAIASKYPILSGENKVWAAADGLKLPLQLSGNWMIQNRYYNGWQSSTYINSVFVFAPDGRIRICVVNAPGSFHDSTISEYGVYDKMESVYDRCGAKVVVDSAFHVSGNEFLIQGAQQDPLGDGKSGVSLNRAATSVRQLSEWGMRMIQGQFPRLKDRMSYEEFGERKVIQSLMVLLYNYQTSTMGMNEILNSFMSRTKGFYGYKDVELTATANDLFPCNDN